MNYNEYREIVKAEIIELIKTQLNMTLTEGARKSAHSQLKGLMEGSSIKAWELFDFEK